MGCQATAALHARLMLDGAGSDGSRLSRVSLLGATSTAAHRSPEWGWVLRKPGTLSPPSRTSTLAILENMETCGADMETGRAGGGQQQASMRYPVLL